MAACSDLRAFEGEWAGARTGDSPAVRVGLSDQATARLRVDDVDRHGLRGALAVEDSGLVVHVSADLASLPGAEADALATMSFTGAPLRVYMAFVPMTDGLGDATGVIGLYDGPRMDLRLLRGGPAPIYAIFALSPRE